MINILTSIHTSIKNNTTNKNKISFPFTIILLAVLFIDKEEKYSTLFICYDISMHLKIQHFVIIHHNNDAKRHVLYDNNKTGHRINIPSFLHLFKALLFPILEWIHITAKYKLQCTKIENNKRKRFDLSIYKVCSTSNNKIGVNYIPESRVL